MIISLHSFTNSSTKQTFRGLIAYIKYIEIDGEISSTKDYSRGEREGHETAI